MAAKTKGERGPEYTCPAALFRSGPCGPNSGVAAPPQTLLPKAWTLTSPSLRHSLRSVLSVLSLYMERSCNLHTQST
jgi:hypothetical protein